MEQEWMTGAALALAYAGGLVALVLLVRRRLRQPAVRDPRLDWAEWEQVRARRMGPRQ